jgi:peptidoglycan hydrolase-like protein with peptidoglycan-binding domain
VRTIQQRLKDRGKVVAVDGSFGPKTHQVVVAFQMGKHLQPDGVVGPKTWAALWEP